VQFHIFVELAITLLVLWCIGNDSTNIGRETEIKEALCTPQERRIIESLKDVMTILFGACSKEESFIFTVQIESFSILHRYHERSIEEPFYKDCMISDALNWVMISNGNRGNVSG
jgi:hypothetical protein